MSQAQQPTQRTDRGSGKSEETARDLRRQLQRRGSVKWTREDLRDEFAQVQLVYSRSCELGAYLTEALYDVFGDLAECMIATRSTKPEWAHWSPTFRLVKTTGTVRLLEADDAVRLVQG